MPDATVFTFAEIEFLLRFKPERAPAVRRYLRLKSEVATEHVVAAGLASLLARQLCVLDGTTPVPTPQIVAVAAALSSFETHIETIGRVADRVVVAHVFGAPSARIVVYPGACGQFAVEHSDPGESIDGPVVRFVDACFAKTPVVRGPGAVADGSGGDDRACAVAIRSDAGVEGVNIAIARDGHGDWYLSDSLASPSRGLPTTREGAIHRITELIGTQPVPVAP